MGRGQMFKWQKDQNFGNVWLWLGVRVASSGGWGAVGISLGFPAE